MKLSTTNKIIDVGLHVMYVLNIIFFTTLLCLLLIIIIEGF